MYITRKRIIVSLCLILCVTVCGSVTSQETPKPFTLPDPNEAATLSALLADPARSLYDKTLACKVVARQGTAASVPVLAKYLEDPELSHAARIALLQIPGEEARTALCSAIKAAKDVKYVPGLIRTLGQRREPASIGVVVPFLSGKNAEVFAAACDAVTLLASHATLEPLVKVWNSAPSERLPLLVAPMLACAGRCFDANQTGDAATIYRLIIQTKHVTPVTRGRATQSLIALLQGEDRTIAFAKALSSSDQQIFLAAAQTLPLMDRDALAKLLITKFDEVPQERQLVLLDMMKQLRHPTNRDFLFKLATTSGDVKRRCKALDAFAVFGKASDLQPLLASAAKARSGDWSVVVEHLYCLAKIEDPAMDPLVVNMLRKNEGFLRSFMINLGYLRRIHAALDVYLKELRSSDKWNRIAARDACIAVVTVDDLGKLIDVLPGAKDATRVDVLLTLQGVTRKLHDKDKTAQIIADQMSTFDKIDQLALLEPLAETGSRTALGLLKKFSVGTDPDFQDGALKGLGHWPDMTAVPVLLAAAKEIKSEKLQTRAVRAYLRIARQMVMSSQTRLNLVKSIEPFVKRDAESCLLLEALYQARSKEAFMFVAQSLDKPARKETACTLLVELGKFLDINDADVQNTIKQVAAQTSDKATRQAAHDILKGIATTR